METYTIFENVVDIPILGLLVTLGVIFSIGLIINIPAIVIYCRSRQIRSFTDKFILFVVISDIVSLCVLIPTSFLFLLESYDNSNVAIVKKPEAEPLTLEEHPFFLESDIFNSKVGDEVEAEAINSSSVCIQQWIYIVHKFMLIMTANLSVLAALKIAVERYLAVVTPLHYHKVLKSTVVIVVSLISFLLATASAVIMTWGANPDGLYESLRVCESASKFLGGSWSSRDTLAAQSMAKFSNVELKESDSVLSSLPQHDLSNESLNGNTSSTWYLWPVLKLAHATVFFIVPVFVMMFMYIRIWTEASKQNARLAHHSKNPYIFPVDMKKPERLNVDGLQVIFSRFKLMQRLRRRARMDRAARVAFLTIGLIIMCFGPLYYVQIASAIYSLTMTEAVQSAPKSFSKLLLFLPTILACCHPLLSPVVYVYRYKKVRSELTLLLNKLISSMNCCNNGSTDCQDIVHQFNNLAQKLPASPSVDVVINMLESQAMSNTNSDTTLSVNSRNTNTDNLSSDSSGLTEKAYPISSIFCDDKQQLSTEGSETDLESQEYHEQRVISEETRSGLFHLISCWVGSYSRRWNRHRESVTSTASFVTLLSNRNRSIPSVDI
ncbi:C-X-C chemokine receptor type 5 [Orchesella cincta]|uniref:C-X-C chemokine receptor type 5 n=1 Tax=Orchesella cincta TaxID=48709 RepID=A0A1D2NAT2_ORCCI|nr:C-X-C chemokine receptor type 5 [Orchesella cincta]